MDYHEASNVLFELRQFRPKPGTASTEALLEYLGSPHTALACIQIAGSNGKGSTARMTEAILREAGYSVGLYTSPHFDDVRERFKVDGRPMPKHAVTAFVERVGEYLTERTATGDPVTFFEATTAMALWYFAREDVDIAVLEVGIGGRFDATSVVDPIASAVTTVSYEHTEILGETIEEIAEDKAHVASRQHPLVTGATGEALVAIREQVARLHESRQTGLPPDEHVYTVGTEAADVTVEYIGRSNHTEATINLEGPEWSIETLIPLIGEHQAVNAGIATTLAYQVEHITPECVGRGLRRATWPGRFEVRATDPLVVLDGAHNPEACGRLADALKEFAHDRLIVVFGAMHEKDHRAMAEALPTPDVLIASRPMRERAEDPAALANVFERTGATEVQTIPSVEVALEEALDMATPADCVLVTGSLYTVGEARQRWVRLAIPKRIETLDAALEVLESADVAAVDAGRLADAGVHRVIKTRVHPRQARWLEEELRALGGACARSGIDDTIEEPVDIVLMGSGDQFGDLLLAMQDAPASLGALADDLAPHISQPARSNGYPWDTAPCVMGILNVTPDSFYDGGEYVDIDAAVERAEAMVDAGATIIDIGGESTRPGAEAVDASVERDRVVPVIERLTELDAMVSVDTRKADVARAALEAGADMLNDVSGLADPGMRFVAAEYDVPLVVMHSIDTPVVPDRAVAYDDVVEDVISELSERVLLAEQAGLDREQIVVDPGIGFGKAAADSFALLGRIGELGALGCPILVGHSHKSMFESIGCGPDTRLAPTIAGTSLAVAGGADIVRVHDVEPNVAAIRTVTASQTG